MLFFAIVFLFCGVCKATTSEEKESLNEIFECEKKVGINHDDAVVVFKNRLNGADEKFKCLIACLIEDYYEFNNDGAFDAETTIAKIRGPAGVMKDSTIKALRACSNIKGSSECDAIFKVYKCTMENVEKLFNAKHA